MSSSCGYNFFYQNDELFQKYLGDFYKKYGFTGVFNGFYYYYPSSEARWAFLSRMGYMEYECPTGQLYYELMELLEGKKYHIMTTNQDFQFTRVVSEEKLSAIQGDSRYYQCSRRCHDQIYYNKEMVYAMNAAIDENLWIPTEMIPRCPKCGAQMEPWVRGYTFLEGAKWRNKTMEEKFRNIYQAIQEADALLIGASNGLSISEGYNILADDHWFQENFGDFRSRYGIRNILQGLFFQYPSEESKWAFFSRLISRNCYLKQPGPVMEDLYRLVGSKDYFIVTSWKKTGDPGIGAWDGETV